MVKKRSEIVINGSWDISKKFPKGEDSMIEKN